MLPERKVVRHIGRTDGTERYSIEGAQLRHTALRQSVPSAFSGPTPNRGA
jgi:hypothetical protein